MKKFLLSFLLVASAFFSFSQNVKFNEFYVRPSCTSPTKCNSEYFELFNTGATENLDCYVMVTYFNDGRGNQGFYLLDFPNVDLAAGGFFLGAPKASFNFQTGPNPVIADYNWNNPGAYTNAQTFRYVLNSNGTAFTSKDNVTSVSGGFNDIFLESPTVGGNKVYANFLYKYDAGLGTYVFVDALLGASNNGEIPSLIAQVQADIAGADAFTTSCGTFTLDFQDFNKNGIIDNNNQQAEIFSHVGPSAGTDNGYILECDHWEKSSSPDEHTPGKSNPNVLPGADFSQFVSSVSLITSDCSAGDFLFNFGDDPFASQFPPALFGIPFTAALYVDNGPVGPDPSDQFITSKSVTVNSDPVAAPANTTPASPIELTDPNPSPSGKNYLLVFTFSNFCSNNIIPYATGCEVTPVTLKSFNATRKGSNVELNWETASETNNKGFYIQRNTGNAVWENVSFVPTKAANGNTSSALSYSFVDANNTNKVVTQYRLRQEDKDGKFKYSDIRSVRGLEQLSKVLIYPNPNKDGKVNVVFDDASGNRNVVVTDMAGRIIQQLRGITSSSIQINNLMAGFYNIKIMNVQTGENSIQKLIVTK
jgi:hypothetical protein